MKKYCLFLSLILCSVLIFVGCDQRQSTIQQIASPTAIIVPSITPTEETENTITPQSIYQLGISDRLGMGDFYGFAISPDGKTLAIATSSGIFLYDRDTLAQKQFIDFPEIYGRFNSQAIAYSPDGKFLAFGKKDIYIWNLAGNRLEYTIRNLLKDYSIVDIKFSPKGDTIAAMSMGTYDACDARGGNYALYTADIYTKLLYSDLFCPEAGDYFFDFSNNGTVAFVGDSIGDYQVSIVDSSTGDILKRQGYHGTVSSISPDGSKLSNPVDQQSTPSDSETADNNDSSNSSYSEITNIINPLTNKIINRVNGNLIFLQDPQNRQLLINGDQWDLVDANQNEICHFSQSPNLSFDYLVSDYTISENELIYWNDWTQKIEFWNLQSCDLDKDLFIPNIDYAFYLLENGKLLLTQDNQNVYLWNIENKKIESTISRQKELVSAFPNSFKTNPDTIYNIHTFGVGHTVIFYISYPTFSLVVWDIDQGKVISTYTADANWENSIKVSPDQKMVAYSTRKGIYIWDIGTKNFRLFLPLENVNEFSFNSNSTQLFAANQEKLLSYDVLNGNTLSSVDLQSDQFVSTFSNISNNFVDDNPSLLSICSINGNNCYPLKEYPPITLNPNSQLTQKENNAYPSYDKFVFNSTDQILLQIMHNGDQSNLRFWDTNTGKIIREIPFPQYISDAQFSPDNKTLYTTSDGLIYFWKINTPQ
jgi:dipeptidyl aminopeptidase/acylaminoacyl peptidase